MLATLSSSETLVSPDSLKVSLEAGLFTDGNPACVHTLKNKQGMTVSFMDIGATWVSCQVPTSEGKRLRVLLRYEKARRLPISFCFLRRDNWPFC